MNQATIDLVFTAFKSFKPPPKLKLSQWAEEYAYLSAESSAESGKWKNIPYQVGMMDAVTDPRVERITVMKSARVGYTKIIGHIVAYHMHYDPCPICVVQPTDSDAEGYSKEEIAPMIRDSPVLKHLVSDSKTRDSGNTIAQKNFPGGSLSIIGAQSPRGFRRVSRRIMIFDEVDGYSPAGPEGDQIKLGIKRTEYYWNRKIIAGSTPTTTTLSRIEPMFEDSDKRFFHVPCPHCSGLQVLKFPNMVWDEGAPDTAHFVCIHCKEKILHTSKKWMIERGKWIAEKEFKGHAGFHIWAAYSYSPNASWADIAKEFLEAKKAGPEALKTFVMTTLGETWKEKGDAPDWARLYHRRESYPIGEVPPGVIFLTCGVDVQKDRLEYQVIGWGRDKQRYSIEYGQFLGDTSNEESKCWVELDQLLNRSYLGPNGSAYPIKLMGIDSGFNTQSVYNWVRKHSPSQVAALKGSDSSSNIVGTPTSVDINFKGKRIKRGLRLWSIGVSILKSELYSALNLEKPTNDETPYPAGYCHFPQYDEEFFKQLTAEELTVRVVKGFRKFEWVKVRERNEALDTSVYNRACAAIIGIDRFTPEQWDRLDEFQNGIKKKEAETIKKQVPVTPQPLLNRPRRKSTFW